MLYRVCFFICTSMLIVVRIRMVAAETENILMNKENVSPLVSDQPEFEAQPYAGPGSSLGITYDRKILADHSARRLLKTLSLSPAFAKFGTSSISTNAKSKPPPEPPKSTKPFRISIPFFSKPKPPVSPTPSPLPEQSPEKLSTPSKEDSISQPQPQPASQPQPPPKPQPQPQHQPQPPMAVKPSSPSSATQTTISSEPSETLSTTPQNGADKPAPQSTPTEGSSKTSKPAKPFKWMFSWLKPTKKPVSTKPPEPQKLEGTTNPASTELNKPTSSTGSSPVKTVTPLAGGDKLLGSSEMPKPQNSPESQKVSGQQQSQPIKTSTSSASGAPPKSDAITTSEDASSNLKSSEKLGTFPGLGTPHSTKPVPLSTIEPQRQPVAEESSTSTHPQKIGIPPPPPTATASGVSNQGNDAPLPGVVNPSSKFRLFEWKISKPPNVPTTEAAPMKSSKNSSGGSEPSKPTTLLHSSPTEPKPGISSGNSPLTTDTGATPDKTGEDSSSKNESVVEVASQPQKATGANAQTSATTETSGGFPMENSNSRIPRAKSRPSGGFSFSNLLSWGRPKPNKSPSTQTQTPNKTMTSSSTSVPSIEQTTAPIPSTTPATNSASNISEKITPADPPQSNPSITPEGSKIRFSTFWRPAKSASPSATESNTNLSTSTLAGAKPTDETSNLSKTPQLPQLPASNPTQTPPPSSFKDASVLQAKLESSLESLQTAMNSLILPQKTQPNPPTQSPPNSDVNSANQPQRKPSSSGSFMSSWFSRRPSRWSSSSPTASTSPNSTPPELLPPSAFSFSSTSSVSSTSTTQPSTSESFLTKTSGFRAKSKRLASKVNFSSMYGSIVNGISSVGKRFDKWSTRRRSLQGDDDDEHGQHIDTNGGLALEDKEEIETDHLKDAEIEQMMSDIQKYNTLSGSLEESSEESDEISNSIEDSSQSLPTEELKMEKSQEPSRIDDILIGKNMVTDEKPNKFPQATGQTSSETEAINPTNNMKNSIKSRTETNAESPLSRGMNIKGEIPKEQVAKFPESGKKNQTDEAILNPTMRHQLSNQPLLIKKLEDASVIPMNNEPTVVGNINVNAQLHSAFTGFEENKLDDSARMKLLLETYPETHVDNQHNFNQIKNESTILKKKEKNLCAPTPELDNAKKLAKDETSSLLENELSNTEPAERKNVYSDSNNSNSPGSQEFIKDVSNLELLHHKKNSSTRSEDFKNKGSINLRKNMI